jgi:hypothetical protein
MPKGQQRWPSSFSAAQKLIPYDTQPGPKTFPTTSGSSAQPQEVSEGSANSKPEPSPSTPLSLSAPSSNAS